MCSLARTIPPLGCVHRFIGGIGGAQPAMVLVGGFQGFALRDEAQQDSIDALSNECFIELILHRIDLVSN